MSADATSPPPPGPPALADALRAGDERLRSMLDAALDAIIAMDALGKIVWFNPAAERIFGYEASLAVGRDMADLIVPPALRAAHRAGLARHLGGSPGRVLDRRIEIRAQRADASEFAVELTVTRIAGDGDPLFLGYLRDISERQRFEDELRASRARLVEASYEARRRIERDLHDGAQQRLVMLGMSLRMARTRITDPAAAALVDESIEELLAATAELRELARGIHPAVLTDGGLGPALRALLSRSTVPVVLEEVPDERLAGGVEATAYFVVAEALTNVARYAEARGAWVALRLRGPILQVVIRDDGIGGADLGAGTGLDGLRDRLEALGGTLHLHSPEGVGTTLTAEVPCAS
jgi:PAS domain S-box-containing protein